jgi:hypothetical protein
VTPFIDFGAAFVESATIALLSKAVSAIKPPKVSLSISGGTPMVSNRWARQQDKAHEMGRARVGKREGLRQTALGAADGLALNRPFAPWPWRWTLTMVASTIASSMSGSSEQASKS